MATRAMRPSVPRSSPFTIYTDSTSTMSPEIERERPDFATAMNEAYDADASISSTSEDDRESDILPSIEQDQSRKYSAALYTGIQTETKGLFSMLV